MANTNAAAESHATPPAIHINVVHGAPGSASFAHQTTHVLVAVHGPRLPRAADKHALQRGQYFRPPTALPHNNNNNNKNYNHHSTKTQRTKTPNNQDHITSTHTTHLPAALFTEFRYARFARRAASDSIHPNKPKPAHYLRRNKQQPAHKPHSSSNTHAPPWSLLLADQEEDDHDVDDGETAQARALTDALTASIILDQYPHTVIEVHVLVLEAGDGVHAATAAAITCASLALASSGIQCLDLVTAVVVSPHDQKEDQLAHSSSLAVKCNGPPKNASGGAILVACMPSLSQITKVVKTGTTTSHHNTDAASTQQQQQQQQQPPHGMMGMMMGAAALSAALSLALKRCALLADQLRPQIKQAIACGDADSGGKHTTNQEHVQHGGASGVGGNIGNQAQQMQQQHAQPYKRRRMT